ncbi:hypothetical protein [Kineosporia sp. NBRC 101731]|uniref:hypothetical protein n=1 Tax=Kineosporia sp. NBRC 101731 TaxID=3032199 RepID=UPI00255275C3|nr:hypothetical protein [Kineosporia sp. NBRC 101731]
MKENVSGERQAVGTGGAPVTGAGAERAAHLLRRLRSQLRTPDGPVPYPAAPRTPDAELLTWLRHVCQAGLYTDAAEAVYAAALGPDLFGTRVPHPAPDFLDSLDAEQLPAAAVAPFLRALSLTAPRPSADALTPQNLLRDPGPVAAITGELPPDWPGTATLDGIPYVVHSIWLGGPAPADGSLRANLAAAAARYRDELQFVVWTDVTRAQAQAAAPDSAVGSWVRWARAHEVALVNVDEVFHAGAPMLLHPYYLLELAKRLPRGLAGASDHLRLDVLNRFGGIYLDGDLACEPDPGAAARPRPREIARGVRAVVPEGLPAVLEAVAQGPLGFTVHVRGEGVVTDAVVTPARHPVLRLCLEVTRFGGSRSQAALFDGVRTMTGLGPGLPENDLWRRYCVPRRAGRSLGITLQQVGVKPYDARLVRLQAAVRPAQERSWTRTDLPAQDGTDPVVVARDLVTATVRRLIARDGDLHLSAIAPVIEAQPDPAPLWWAVLALIAELAGSSGIPSVRSVTEVRLDDDGRVQQARLPEAVEALLRRAPHGEPWLGAELSPEGGPVWMLGELVRPARLLREPVAYRPVAPLRLATDRARAAADASGQAASVIIAGLARTVRQHQNRPLVPLPTDIAELEGARGEAVLAWLRSLTGLRIGDPEHERRVMAQLGPDLFGFRRPAPEPAFLTGTDSRRLPPERVAAFLAGMSLTRLDGTFLVPEAGELAVGRLARGTVSRVRPGGDWGVPDAPRLPARAAIPHVVHGIWVGGPAPEDGLLRANFGAAAAHYAGRVNFVVWTDLSRAEVARAMAAPEPSGRAAVIVSMMEWAREHGISVVSVAEVFHAGSPMRLWEQYVCDLVKLLPRGYSGASDRLRLEVMTRFGGAYVDSDDRFLFPGDERDEHERQGPQSLPAVFAAVARSVPAFTPHVTPPARVNCDVIVAPARHPALMLWRELDRLSCSLSQPQLFGEADLVQRRANASAYRLWHRYTVAKRAGHVHFTVMSRLGFSHSDPQLVRVMGAVREQSARSWTGSARPPRRAAASLDAVTVRTASVIASLMRRLIARPGNLHLSAVAPVVAAMPDPDAVWLAVMRFFVLLQEQDAGPRITSVTRFRWADDGSPDYLGLPAEVEAMLEPDPQAKDWFGEDSAAFDQPAWVLDETVVPVRLLTPAQAREKARSRRDAAAHAVTADADWLPPGFTGIELTGRLGTAWTDGHRIIPEDLAVRLSGVGTLTGPVLLRMSGGAEHGRAWFAARLSTLLGRAVVVAHGTESGSATSPVSSAVELRMRVDVNRRSRVRRAGDLVAELERLAPSPVPLIPVADTAEPDREVDVPPATREILPWLRKLIGPQAYTAGAQAALAASMGPDPYRRRARPPRPAWLTVDPAGLPPEGVAIFLRWLDLGRLDPTQASRPPDRGDLGVRLMLGETGPVTTVHRDEQARAWAQPEGAPRLPEHGAVPHLVHGIWLGGPLPEHGGFRAHFADAAREYAGRVDFVLWTDVTREQAAAALERPSRRAGGILSMLTWARENGVLVVPLDEVFHEQADMVLWDQIAAERAKRIPRGYAAASDHFRVEIVNLLGGAYVDGDNGFVGGDALPRMFDEVARSVPGFTMHVLDELEGVANDVIVAPAGHPALRLWREVARQRYLPDQPELFGGVHRMTERFIPARRTLLRYSVVHRTGRMHHLVLGLLDLAPRSELLVRVVPYVRHSSELSWAPGNAPELLDDPDPQECVQRLIDVVTVLSRQLVNRRGNLYLSEVAPTVASLPDPDAAWIAVLTRISQLRRIGRIPMITSVTDSRWAESGRMDVVALPPEAEALLVRYPRPDGWLGVGINVPGQPVWLLDESVEPCRLRSPDPRDFLRDPEAGKRFIPVRVRRRDGEVLGLRYDEGIGRELAGALPPGQTLVWVRRWGGSAWSATGRISAEALAGDLIDAGLHERPVTIVTVPGERTSGGAVDAGLGALSGRLASLLGEPVTVVEAPASGPVATRAPQVQVSTPISLRQGEPERRPLARRRLRPDPPAVPFDDAVHGGEADAGAGELALLVQPLER